MTRSAPHIQSRRPSPRTSLLAGAVTLAVAIAAAILLPQAPAAGGSSGAVGAGLVPVECEVAGTVDQPTGTPITDKGGLVVELPKPGRGVAIEIYGAVETQSMTVVRLSDGTTRTEECGAETPPFGGGGMPERAAPPTAEASKNACKDGAFTLAGWAWRKDLAWSFNAKGMPRKLKKKKAIKAIRAGASAITASKNNCKIRDKVDIEHAYAGKTKKRVQAGSSSCNSRGDNSSTVQFGSLRSGVLGMACVWFSDASGKFVPTSEADVVFNDDEKWFLGKKKKCKKGWSLRGVAAHEWGHAFGLGHVSESGHKNLTMSELLNGSCQTSEITLGKGDVRALQKLY